jgi:hypothetical protein
LPPPLLLLLQQQQQQQQLSLSVLLSRSLKDGRPGGTKGHPASRITGRAFPPPASSCRLLSSFGAVAES